MGDQTIFQRFHILTSLALSLISLPTYASVTVDGHTIVMPDDGWYQVQNKANFQEMCNGDASCTVPAGTYIVINHTTGIRNENVVVPQLAITVEGNTLSWPDDGWYQVQNAHTYEEICAGGRSCEVAAGTYNIINHTTGVRYQETISASDVDNPNEISPEPFLHGNIISWPDNGWYQVQNADTYDEICNGGSSCEVPPGEYVVINHSSGERFTGFTVNEDTVVADDPPATPESLTPPVNIIGVLISGRLQLSWTEIKGADSYNIYISSQPITEVGVSDVAQFTGFSGSFAGSIFGSEGQSYYVRLSTNKDGRESALSEESRFTAIDGSLHSYSDFARQTTQSGSNNLGRSRVFGRSLFESPASYTTTEHDLGLELHSFDYDGEVSSDGRVVATTELFKVEEYLYDEHRVSLRFDLRVTASEQLYDIYSPSIVKLQMKYPDDNNQPGLSYYELYYADIAGYAQIALQWKDRLNPSAGYSVEIINPSNEGSSVYDFNTELLHVAWDYYPASGKYMLSLNGQTVVSGSYMESAYLDPSSRFFYGNRRDSLFETSFFNRYSAIKLYIDNYTVMSVEGL